MTPKEGFICNCPILEVAFENVKTTLKLCHCSDKTMQLFSRKMRQTLEGVTFQAKN